MADGSEYEKGRRDAQIDSRFQDLEDAQHSNDNIQRALRTDVEDIRRAIQELVASEKTRHETDRALKRNAEAMREEARSSREASQNAQRWTIDKRMFWIGICTVIAIWLGTFISLYTQVVH